MNRQAMGVLLISATLALVVCPADADDRAELDRLIRIARDASCQQVRREGERIARRIGAERAYALLVLAMKEDDRVVKLYAARGIAAHGGPVCKAAVGDLIKALRDGDPELRKWSASALGKIGPDARPAVGELVAALRDDDAEVQSVAVAALGGIGPAASAAVAPLIALMKDEAGWRQSYPPYALGRIGPVDERVVPALIETAGNSPDPRKRSSATAALAAIVMQGRRNLEAASAPDRPKIRQGVDQAIAALMAKLADADSGVRIRALQGLGWAGRTRKDVAAAVMKLLDDPDARVRRSALQALGAMGAGAKAAVAAIVGLLSHEDVEVRQAAAESLSRIDPAAAVAAMPMLLEWLRTARGYPRYHPALILSRIGPPAREAVGDLVEALKDRDYYARSWAASALGAIGPDARAAVGPLKRAAIFDAHEMVRRSAAAALKKIRKPPPKPAP